MKKQFELVIGGLFLVLSGSLFAQAWWGHWLFMAMLSSGAFVIIGSWLYLGGKTSPLNLLPAAFLLLYYTNLPGKLLPFLTIGRTAATYDDFLCYVDRSFGFFPSLLVCRWVGSVPHLDQFFFGIYMALSLAMGVCFAAHIGQVRPPWKIVVILAVTATIGVLSYNLLPACGPLMLFGSSDFLHGNAFAAFPNTQPTMVSLSMRYPRNAMPSLHMTWALVLLWICRDLKRGRWLAALFVVLTAVATLSSGEHYFVDLVVAFPFALAIWNLCVGTVPLSHPKRTLTIAGATMAYLAWIVAIRFAPGIFYISSVFPWLVSLATVAGTMIFFYSQPVIQFAGQERISLHRTQGKLRKVYSGPRIGSNTPV